jgi:hypothetical protein
MSRDQTIAQRSSEGPATGPRNGAERRPFRAVDVLSGSIDRPPVAKPARARKQISAQLEPGQLRLLGELHARLNATASERIEKSDLVGLGIELLAAAIAQAEQDLAPAPDTRSLAADLDARRPGTSGGLESVAAIRSYVHTYVRDVGKRRDRISQPAGQSGRYGDSEGDH